jgi:antitoxin CcdA
MGQQGKDARPGMAGPRGATDGGEQSRTAEAVGGEASGIQRSRRWREENRASLDRYAREVERDGVALARFRSF